MSDVSDGSASALPDLDEPGDAELISAVRGGDLDAYGLLFERHVEAARRLSRQLVSAGDVDDLVSEGFSKVLGVLQRGGGPDLAFRAYLLTSIRRLHIDKMRSGARLQTTDDLTPYDPGVAFEDTAVTGFENAAAARAFHSLPERWQQVLWHTEVEGQKPADVAPLLGMSANSVSALAYRAREGLRQAFVTMHAQDAATDECANIRSQFGAYIRGGVSKRDSAKIEAHLQDCRECTAIYLELAEVNSNLGAVLAPIVLGTAGAGYLAAHAGAVVAAKGGVLLFLDRGKDWVLHNPVGRATGGVAGAAVAAVAVAAAAGAFGGHSPAASVAQPSKPASASAAPQAPAPQPAAPQQTTPKQTTRPPAAATTVPVVKPVATPTPKPAPQPRPTPTPPSAHPPAPDKPVIQTPLAPVQVQPSQGGVLIDLTLGAKDPLGRPLSLLSASLGLNPHGTLVIGGNIGPAHRMAVAAPRSSQGTVLYTPKPGWRGTETIHYTLTNRHGGTVSGTVDVTTGNAAPVAVDDAVLAHVVRTSGSTTVDVLANDSDPNGDALTITGVSGATHGTATVVGNKVVFTPTQGYVGDATFRYTISDGHGGSASANATITYGMQPDAAPVAPAVSVTTQAGQPVTLDLTARVSDPDGDPMTISVADPAHGTVTREGDDWVYQPAEGFSGTDTFSYTASDGVRSTTGTITVHVVEPTRLDLTWGEHGAGVAYLDATVSGLPANGRATLVVRIEGFARWTGQGPGAECEQSSSGDLMTLTCTVSTNGDVLRENFVPSRSDFSVDGSLTANQ